MTPDETAAIEWYGHLRVTEVLPCPVCGAGVPLLPAAALRHRQWHEERDEVPR